MIWQLKTLWVILILVFLLHMVDTYTTYKILKNGGIEVNPVMKKAFDTIGFFPTRILSQAFLAVISYFMLRKYDGNLITLIVGVFMIAISIYAITNNIYQLHKNPITQTQGVQ